MAQHHVRLRDLAQQGFLRFQLALTPEGDTPSEKTEIVMEIGSGILVPYERGVIAVTGNDGGQSARHRWVRRYNANCQHLGRTCLRDDVGDRPHETRI